MTVTKPRPFGSAPVQSLSGHKCLGAKLCVEVSCECGWISCPHSGENARGAAYSEWRDQRSLRPQSRGPVMMDPASAFILGCLIGVVVGFVIGLGLMDWPKREGK
jgi:hypothetical protein